MKSTKINPINLITIFDGRLFTEGKLPSPKYECCNGFHIVSSDIFGVKIGWLLKPQSIFQVPKYSILEPSYLKIDKRLILEWVFDQFWFKRHQTKRYEKGYDIIEVFMKNKCFSVFTGRRTAEKEIGHFSEYFVFILVEYSARLLLW